MNATAVDVKEMLETYVDELDSSSSVPTVFYPIFIGKEPATPTNTITIFETMAFHDLTMNRSEIYELPRIQIRVRSTSYLEGWGVIDTIKNLLHGRANETWNGALYTLIRCYSGPGLLDYDKEQSVRFVVNFEIQRR